MRLQDEVAIIGELSPEHRLAFQKSVTAFLELYYSGFLVDQHHFFGDDGQEKGITYLEVGDDLRDAIDTHYAGVRESLDASEPEGIDDGAVARYEALREKWTQIVLDLGYDTGFQTKAEWAASTPDYEEPDLSAWAKAVEDEVLSKYLWD